MCVQGKAFLAPPVGGWRGYMCVNMCKCVRGYVDGGRRGCLCVKIWEAFEDPSTGGKEGMCVCGKSFWTSPAGREGNTYMCMF